MKTKIMIVLLIISILFIKGNSLNHFSHYELSVNSPISCIKYIEGMKILAVALNTTGIDFYDISGTSVVYSRSITTTNRVNSMVSAVNNSRLIYTEDYRVSVIDFSSRNDTYSAQIAQRIHQIFPNGTSIILQTQSIYSTYVCSIQTIVMSLKCIQSSLPFTGLATYFMKPNTHDDRQTAIAYQGQLKSMDIRIENTYNTYTVLSNITDIVYYSNIYQALIMTNTQSVYRTSVPTYGSYQDCRQIDLNVSIFKQSVIDRQEKVFFYITNTGQVKGRNVQDLKLAYYIPIANIVQIQSLESNQDILIRTGDSRLFFIWTISYDDTNTIFENLAVCPDQSGVFSGTSSSTNTNTGTTSGTTTNTTNTTSTTNTTTTSNTTTTNTTSPQTTNTTSPQTTNTTSSTTNSTVLSINTFSINDTTLNSTNTTASNTTVNQQINTNNTSLNNSTQQFNNTTNLNSIIIDNQSIVDNGSSVLEEKQLIFYCQLNCQKCENQLICVKCKQGYELTLQGQCQASESIDLFSTIISIPYSGIVMNFILMDFMQEFWFFQHHNFNYTPNIARIFSLVGSLNRNKIISPVFKYLIRDTVSNVNTRTISHSNFIPYTPIAFQKAQNTDAYFISNISGMFIWAYSLILFMFAFTYFGHRILSKIFDSDLLLKFSTKPIILFLLLSPFIQYISFHSFCQLRLFFSFNAADKFNLVLTICFLGTALFFSFAGFPIFYYLNYGKLAKLIYSQQNNLNGYIKSFFLWSGKLFYLGFINGYIHSFTAQCVNLSALYVIQIWLLRKQISIKQKDSSIRATVFFKFVMKLLSFAFVLCSLCLNLNLGDKYLLQPNQEISIVGIWTWALAQLIFKFIQILLIGYRALKQKVSSFFTQSLQNPRSLKYIENQSKPQKRVQKTQKNTTINISDILDDKTLNQNTIKTGLEQKSQRVGKIKVTKSRRIAHSHKQQPKQIE